jgi:hypothetical protein
MGYFDKESSAKSPLSCQYHYEILPRPVQLGGGVWLYLYGPNLETGEQIDYGSAVFPSDSADPNTLKDAYTAAREEGDSWLESQIQNNERRMYRAISILWL